MAGIAIGFDTLLSNEQNSVPVPREYNQARVLTDLSSWENKQQKDHEHLKTQEGRAGLKFMMKVEDKNSRGVYKPKYDDRNTYPWVNCMPPLSTQKLLWDEDFVVDAIGNQMEDVFGMLYLNP